MKKVRFRLFSWALGVTVLLCFSCFGQAINVSGGPNLYTIPPYTAGSVSFCIGSDDTCSYTTFEGRGTISLVQPPQLQYSVVTGIKQTVAKAQASWVMARLFTLAQGGISVGSSSTTGAAKVGGGIDFIPARFPNWNFSPMAKAYYAPNNNLSIAGSGWQVDELGLQIGYTFRK